MKVGAGRTVGLGIATLAVSLGFAAAADAAKLPKFSVTNVSNPPTTAEPGDDFTALGVVQNDGKKSGKATVRISLRTDNVAENGPIALGMTETDKVKKGESTEFGVQSTIPEDTADGTYYMVACATPAKGSGCLVAANQVTVATPPPVFTPGSRGTDDDLYPQTGNGGYDATKYDIDLIYDPVTNLFEAGTKTTMTATATQNLSEFSMDFQDIGVTAVTVNGQPADSFDHELAEPAFVEDFATDLEKLVIDPAGDGILDGTVMTVVVEYAGEPALITDPDEAIEGWVPACYVAEAIEVCDGGLHGQRAERDQRLVPVEQLPDRQGDVRHVNHRSGWLRDRRHGRARRRGSRRQPGRHVDLELDGGRSDLHVPGERDGRPVRLDDAHHHGVADGTHDPAEQLRRGNGDARSADIDSDRDRADRGDAQLARQPVRDRTRMTRTASSPTGSPASVTPSRTRPSRTSRVTAQRATPA